MGHNNITGKEMNKQLNKLCNGAQQYHRKGNE